MTKKKRVTPPVAKFNVGDVAYFPHVSEKKGLIVRRITIREIYMRWSSEWTLLEYESTDNETVTDDELYATEEEAREAGRKEVTKQVKELLKSISREDLIGCLE